ncbi:MAG TPA: hypothetical protein VG649_22540, partial [Candidatus Angelobacter sp.]|nr:hypothetical protein [Candidatus Angelobacter sp.]
MDSSWVRQKTPIKKCADHGTGEDFELTSSNLIAYDHHAMSYATRHRHHHHHLMTNVSAGA